MKHRRSPSWIVTRRRRQLKHVSAERTPVQLAMFEGAEDGVAETSPRTKVIAEPTQAAGASRGSATHLKTLDPVLLISDDGVIEFRLTTSAIGMTLTRVHRRTPNERVDMSIAFRSERSFLQWCEADPLRHTYPLLLMRLKRSGCALFDRTK